MSRRESLGYLLVAALLMVGLIVIALVSPDDSQREFDLTMKNLSQASLGVPKD